MKPYTVTQADVDALDANTSGIDDDIASAFDVVAFYLFPDVTPPDGWPEGAKESDVAKFVANPVMSMSFAIRQLDEIVAGIAHRMVFAFYRLQLVKAAAAAPDSDAAKFSTVATALNDWVLTNIAATSEANVNAFFLHIHKTATEGATKLVLTLRQNEVEWVRMHELCEKYGISFDAVQAKDADALHAVEIAAVKDMPNERLGQYVFMARMSPDANQDAVAIAVQRLAELEAAAGGEGNTQVVGNFKPALAEVSDEEHIRA